MQDHWNLTSFSANKIYLFSSHCRLSQCNELTVYSLAYVFESEVGKSFHFLRLPQKEMDYIRVTARLLLLCNPWWNTGKWRYSLFEYGKMEIQPFWGLAWHREQVSRNVHSLPPSVSGKEPPLPFEEARWGPQPLWTLLSSAKSLVSTENRNSILRSSSL